MEKKTGSQNDERGKGEVIMGMTMRMRGLAVKYIGFIIAFIILAARPDESNRVIFLDVGQGDCCIVQTASGENYLFDCGSSNRSSIGKYVLLPCLKYYGISELEAVFVSHPDADHMNGIAELLVLAEANHLKIKQLVLPAIEKEVRTEQFGEMLALVERAGSDVKVAFLGAGESWGGDGARFVCLHPKRNYMVKDSNVYSMCVYADFISFSLLLTGDVEGAGENALTEELAELGIDKVTILKVAHHGSRYSTSNKFLAQISPGIAVVSSGRNNRYGHPHKETLDRLEAHGATVYQTKNRGAIIVQEDGGKVWLETFWRDEIE